MPLLMDDLRDALQAKDRSRISYPLGITDYEEWRSSNERRFPVPGLGTKAWDAMAERIRTPLNRAARFVLDDDFTRLVTEIALQPPSVLYAHRPSILLPYDTMWIEWNEHVRQQHSRAVQKLDLDEGRLAHVSPRVGMLIEPYVDYDVPREGQQWSITPFWLTAEARSGQPWAPVGQRAAFAKRRDDVIRVCNAGAAKMLPGEIGEVLDFLSGRLSMDDDLAAAVARLGASYKARAQ